MIKIRPTSTLLMLIVFGAPSTRMTAPVAAAPQDPPPYVAPEDMIVDGDDVSKKRALEVIQAMRTAYRKTPVLVDNMVISESVGGQPVPVKRTRITLGPDTQAEMKSDRQRFLCVDDMVYMTDILVEDKYVEVEMYKNLLMTCIREFNQVPGINLHLRARYSRSYNEIIEALTFGMPYPARISNYRRITNADGVELDQVTLTASQGLCTLNFDPETHFLHDARVDFTPPRSPFPSFRMVLEIKCDPVVYDALPEPLVFTPVEGTRPVPSLGALYGKADETLKDTMNVAVGRPAPGFTEYTLEGAEFDLATELDKGIVTLVFWSATNIESQLGMDAVRDLYAWGKTRGIAVWPVNTRERDQHKSDRWTRAFDWWDKKGYRMPSIFDAEFRIAEAYGVEALPVAVVIRSDGTIHEIVAGISEDWLPQIKAIVSDAYAASREDG